MTFEPEGSSTECNSPAVIKRVISVAVFCSTPAALSDEMIGTSAPHCRQRTRKERATTV